MVEIVATALLCVAVFLYGLYCAIHIGMHCTEYSPDEAHYIAMARRMLKEGMYSFWGSEPDAYVTPGYPVLLAVCLSVFGTGDLGLFSVKVFQAAMVSGIVFLTILLGKRLTARFSAGLIAGTLTAGNLTFQFFANHLLTEVPYCYFMMLFFYCLCEALRRQKLWLHMIAGALFAAAVLIRPLIFVTLPFLYLPVMVRSRGRAWKALVFFLIGSLVFFVPWWIRNLIVLDKFILFATQTNPFFAGLAEDPYGLGLDDPGTIFGNLKLFVEFVIKWPIKTLRWMTFDKFNIIFGKNFGSYHAVVLTAFIQNVTVYVGLCSAVCAFCRKSARGALLIFWVYFASTFLFVPDPRYALQYIPLFGILAGWLITASAQEEQIIEASIINSYRS